MVKATGREHLGQTLGIASGPGQNEMSPNQGLDVAADGKVIGQYTESFAYDLANNILSLKHELPTLTTLAGQGPILTQSQVRSIHLKLATSYRRPLLVA